MGFLMIFCSVEVFERKMGRKRGSCKEVRARQLVKRAKRFIWERCEYCTDSEEEVEEGTEGVKEVKMEGKVEVKEEEEKEEPVAGPSKVPGEGKGGKIDFTAPPKPDKEYLVDVALGYEPKENLKEPLKGFTANDEHSLFPVLEDNSAKLFAIVNKINDKLKRDVEEAIKKKRGVLRIASSSNLKSFLCHVKWMEALKPVKEGEARASSVGVVAEGEGGSDSEEEEESEEEGETALVEGVKEEEEEEEKGEEVKLEEESKVKSEDEEEVAIEKEEKKSEVDSKEEVDKKVEGETKEGNGEVDEYLNLRAELKKLHELLNMST